MIKTKTVNSSAIRKITYDSDKHQLIINFTDDTAYKYFGVPPYVYYEFMNAESFGRYYNESFRGEEYEFIKLS